MPSLRVLVLSGSYPPEIGGPSRYLPPLLERLAARGHTPEAVVFGDPAAATGDPWPVRRVSRRLPLPLRLPRFVLAARRAARRADVVFAVQQAVPAAAVARLARRPLVLRVVGDLAWEHAVRRGATDLGVDAFATAPLRGRIARVRKVHRRAVRRARRVLVPSNDLAGLVKSWGVPAERIRTVPNALVPDDREPPDRAAARARLGITGPAVLAVGRLVPWKGFDDLIRAAGALPAGTRLDVLGDGPQEDALRTLAHDLGLAHRVTLHGAADRMRVGEHLAAADVLALPSSYEGLSHVLLEACAAGLPAVTTRAGGNPEVIRDGEEGLLVEPGDVSGLAAALARVLREDALRARLAAGARRRATDFPYDALVDATEAVLREGAAS